MLLLKHSAAMAFLAGLACGQSFEAASVKPSPLTGGRFSLKGGPGSDDPSRITYSNVPLRIVLLRAYDVKNYQLTGPDWLNTLRFDITASIPPGTSGEPFRNMLRSLLEARFRLALHRETKEMPIYELLPGKKGARIKPAAAEAPEGEIATALPGAGPDGFPKLSLPSPGVIIETKNGVARITVHETTLAKFCDTLTVQAGRPVMDRTGLAGTYSFVVYFTPDGANAGDSPEPNLFAALQEQLGLRLEPARGPVEFLAIDHAEKIPTEN